MEVVEFNSERFAAMEVVQEGIVRLSCLRWFLLSEIDEIGAVGENMAGSIIAMFRA
jgi:hypothetical protein